MRSSTSMAAGPGTTTRCTLGGHRDRAHPRSAEGRARRSCGRSHWPPALVDRRVEQTVGGPPGLEGQGHHRGGVDAREHRRPGVGIERAQLAVRPESTPPGLDVGQERDGVAEQSSGGLVVIGDDEAGRRSRCRGPEAVESSCTGQLRAGSTGSVVAAGDRRGGRRCGRGAGRGEGAGAGRSAGPEDRQEDTAPEPLRGAGARCCASRGTCRSIRTARRGQNRQPGPARRSC